MWLCDQINIKSYRPVKVHPHISLRPCKTTSSLRKGTQHFVGFFKKMMKDECIRRLFKIEGAKHKTLDFEQILHSDNSEIH